MDQIEVIKSYLVELGMTINKVSESQFYRSLASLESKVESFAAKTAKGIGKAAEGLTSMAKVAADGSVKFAAGFAAMNVGVAKFLSGIGQAEIGVEKFASQFYISYDAARQLQGILKTMHVTIEDLYRSPTLARQFQQLRDQAAKMAVPQDFRQQMSLLQNLTFQFTRLRLEVTTSFQWIGYWFSKIFGAQITDITDKFSQLNDRIVRNMPVWTKLVAEWIGNFFRLGGVAFQALEYIGKAFEKMPTKIKEIAVALGVLGLALRAGPLGMISLLLSGVLLLLDDFFTYMRGGDSLLGPVWGKMLDWFKQLKQSGIIDQVTAAISDLGDGFTQMLGKIAGSIGDHSGIFQQLLELFVKLEPKIKWLITDGIPWLVNEILDLSEKFLSWLNQGDHLDGLLETIKYVALGILAIKVVTEGLIKPLGIVIGLLKGLKSLKSLLNIGKGAGDAAKGGSAAARGGAAAAEGAGAAELGATGAAAGELGAGGAAAIEGGALAAEGGALAAGAAGATEGAEVGILGGPLGIAIGGLLGAAVGWGVYQIGSKIMGGKKDEKTAERKDPNSLAPAPATNPIATAPDYPYVLPSTPQIMASSFYPGARPEGSVTNNHTTNANGGNIFNTSPTFNIYSASGDPEAIANTVNDRFTNLITYKTGKGVLL